MRIIRGAWKARAFRRGGLISRKNSWLQAESEAGRGTGRPARPADVDGCACRLAPEGSVTRDRGDRASALAGVLEGRPADELRPHSRCADAPARDCPDSILTQFRCRHTLPPPVSKDCVRFESVSIWQSHPLDGGSLRSDDDVRRPFRAVWQLRRPGRALLQP